MSGCARGPSSSCALAGAGYLSRRRPPDGDADLVRCAPAARRVLRIGRGSRHGGGARPVDRHADHARAGRAEGRGWRGRWPPRGAVAAAVHARHAAPRAVALGARARRGRASRRLAGAHGAVRRAGAHDGGSRRGGGSHERCGCRRRAVRRAAPHVRTDRRHRGRAPRVGEGAARERRDAGCRRRLGARWPGDRREARGPSAARRLAGAARGRATPRQPRDAARAARTGKRSAPVDTRRRPSRGGAAEVGECARVGPRARRSRRVRDGLRVAVRGRPRAAARVDRTDQGEGRVRDRRVRRDDRQRARQARARARSSSPDDAVARQSVVTPVRIANRRDGGWWWRLPLLAVIWLVLAEPVVAGLSVAITLRRWARDLPEVPDRDAWRAAAPQTTLLVAADGTYLAELPYRDGKVIGHRTLLPLEAMPPQLVAAVLAAEDNRYYDHHGVDYTAIIRAAKNNCEAGRDVEGASTITQQVARTLLPKANGTARHERRQVREALLARAIEKRWTKHDVLETYLDFVFLGEGAYGMAAAAHAYFAKDVGALDLAESALLAGLIQAPGRLDPYHHLDAAKARRDEVLARMLRAHLIDEPARARSMRA